MTDKVDSFQLDREQAVLVVVDVQQRLTPAMDQKVYRRILGSIELLLKVAAELKIPVVTTEQYSKGLGHTVLELAAACADGVVEKMSFGCCGEPDFVSRMKSLGRTQPIIVGMEAHVCVYQTVLGLLGAGYHVHLVRDAICSRNKTDFNNALQLAAAAGAVVTTTETATFQLLEVAGTPEFKVISKLIRER